MKLASLRATVVLVGVAAIPFFASNLADAASSALVVAAPATVTANTPFSVTVTLTDGSGNVIRSSTDRIYITVNRLGAQTLLTTNGVVTFSGLRATTTPVTLVVTDPSRSLTKTVVVPAGQAPSITSGATASFPAGQASTFLVTTNGSPAPRITAATPPGSTFLPPGVTFRDNGTGTATLSGSALTVGTYTFPITASNGILPNAQQSFTLTVTGTVGSPDHLSFRTGPQSGTTAGAVFSPSIQVAVVDVNNLTVSSFSGTITVAIGNNPSSGALGGTLSRPAPGGVATFNDLSIDASGTGYTLTATASGTPSVPSGGTSGSFAIAARSAPDVTVTSFSGTPSPRVEILGNDTLGWTVTGTPTTQMVFSGNGNGYGPVFPQTSQVDATFTQAPSGVDPRSYGEIRVNSAATTGRIAALAVAEKPSLVPDSGTSVEVDGVATLPDGSSLAAGLGTTNSGKHTVFVEHYAANGTSLWSSSSNTAVNNPAKLSVGGLAALPDGSSVVVGTAFSTITFGSTDLTGGAFVVRYNPDGSLAWATGPVHVGSVFLAGPLATARGVTPLLDGGVAVTGYFVGKIQFGSTPVLDATGTSAGAFLVRYDRNGNALWAVQSAGSSGSATSGAAVSASPDGALFVTGSFRGATAFGASNLSPAASSNVNIFAARFSASGSVSWASGFGGASNDQEGTAVAAYPDGSSAITGYFDGTLTFGGLTALTALAQDGFVVWLAPNGTPQRQVQIGGPGFNFGSGVAVLADGGVVVSGGFQQTCSFGSLSLVAAASGIDNGFVACYDAFAGLTWVERMGDAANGTDANAVAAFADGGVVVGGAFAAPLAVFGPGETGQVLLQPSGTEQQDGFVARYAPVNYRMLELRPQGLSFVATGGGAGWQTVFAAAATYPDGSFSAVGEAVGPAASKVRFGSTDVTVVGDTDGVIVNYASNGALVSINQIKANAGKHVRLTSIASFPDGSSTVTGTLDGTATFDASPSGTLTSPSGTDVFVARYDASHAFVWAEIVTGGSLQSGHVAALADGGTVVSGFFSGTADFGNGSPLTAVANFQMFLARYDSTGAVVWARTYTQTATQVIARRLAAYPDGSFVLSGWLLGGTLSLGSATLTAPAGTQEGFLARFDATGTPVWAVQCSGASSDHSDGTSVALAPDGSVFFSGYFRTATTLSTTSGSPIALSGSGYDAFVAKYKPDGTLLWARSGGGTGTDDAWGSVALLDGSVVVTGTFTSPSATFGTASITNAATQSMFLVRYDTAGNLLYVKAAGGSAPGFTSGYWLAALPDGSVVIPGEFSASSTFGTGEPNAKTVSAAGSSDAFVAKYFPYVSQGSAVFSSTGADQTFTVPSDVTSITVKLWGAGGGQGDPGVAGGGGGFTTGTIAVTPGETLTIIVGQGGFPSSAIVYGGGGDGAPGNPSYGSGGGRSAIRRSFNELVTAGGGGGGGTSAHLLTPGGAGGGLMGETSQGGGGTQVAGGPGVGSGTSGTAFVGGEGRNQGGGGGGGYYGGGGADTAAGGGGSGFIGGPGVSSASTVAGAGSSPAMSGDPDYTAGTGVGGAGANGGSGRVVIRW